VRRPDDLASEGPDAIVGPPSRAAPDELYRAITEHVRDLLVVLEARRDEAGAVADLVFRDANEAMLAALRLPRERLVGRTAREVLPERFAAMLPRLRDVLRTGQPFRQQQAFGGRRYAVTAFRVDDETVAVAANDVTDVLRGEDAVRRYELLAEHTRDLILFLRRDDGRILDANAAAEAAYGYAPDALRALTIHDLRAPGTEGLTLAQLAEADATGVRFETVHRRSDGSTFPVEVSSQGATLRGARVLVSLVRDVTDRRRAEEALRRSEALYRSLFENMTEGFALAEVEVDGRGVPQDFRLLAANRAAERHTGLRLREAVGRTASELAPGAAPDVVAALRRVALSGDPVHLETYVAAMDRHYECYLCLSAPRQLAILFRDVTQRARAEEALRASERRAAHRAAELQTVLDTVPAAVLIARDRDANEIEGNRYARQLFRLAGHGSNLSRTGPRANPPPYRILRGGVDVPPSEMPVQTAARGIEVRDCELQVELPDGTRIELHGNASPITEGDAAGAVAAFVDITARKAVEDALRETDQRRSEFLAVLSHELRNPLAPIVSALQMLDRAPPGSGAAGRAREVIERQTRHLTRLVDDLLDVTRIARGKIELRRAVVDLREVVRRACDDHRALLEQGGLRFRVATPEAPVPVEADATRVSQVIGNLLQNAAKFTPAGGTVAVEVALREGAAEIRVTDDGAGIAPALVPRIFEPFVQGDGGMARTRGGLGLGLALVKGLVELHGGSVRARSDGAGRGAELSVTLPLAAPAHAAAAVAPAPGPAGPLRILVVEDNLDAAETLADVLALEGHAVEIASTGIEGIAKARDGAPDAVLCDIGLPDVDGYAVARALRAEPRLAATRLVAVSGYALPEDRERARAAGFDAHVAKPPRLEVLLAALAPAVVHEG
jgi:PAS domain S-box-containing protein